MDRFRQMRQEAVSVLQCPSSSFYSRNVAPNCDPLRQASPMLTLGGYFVKTGRHKNEACSRRVSGPAAFPTTLQGPAQAPLRQPRPAHRLPGHEQRRRQRSSSTCHVHASIHPHTPSFKGPAHRPKLKVNCFPNGGITVGGVDGF